jgi:hypothetical protein
LGVRCLLLGADPALRRRAPSGQDDHRDRHDKYVGGIDLEQTCTWSCDAEILASARLLGLDKDIDPVVITGSGIEIELRERGLGVELYATAIWYATTHLRQPLVAHQCCYGETSEMAERVWRSRWLAKVAAVHGLTAVWTGPKLAMRRTVVL